MQDPSSQTKDLNNTPAGESQFPNLLTIWGVHSLYYEKKVCCLYINFVESFCNKSNLEFCWILPNVLLEVWKWSYDFILCCANLVCHLIDLHIWNHSCIPEINPIWSWIQDRCIVSKIRTFNVDTVLQHHSYCSYSNSTNYPNKTWNPYSFF